MLTMAAAVSLAWRTIEDLLYIGLPVPVAIAIGAFMYNITDTEWEDLGLHEQMWARETNFGAHHQLTIHAIASVFYHTLHDYKP